MRVCVGHTLYKGKNGSLSAFSPSGEENTSPDVQALLRAFLCGLDVAFVQSLFRVRRVVMVYFTRFSMSGGLTWYIGFTSLLLSYA